MKPHSSEKPYSGQLYSLVKETRNYLSQY